MFKIFELNYREFPYVDIKIGEWCTAACTDCRYNINYLKTVKQYSFENIKKRIEKFDELFDKKFNIVFGNQDIINHNEIFKILDFATKYGREVRVQTNFLLTQNHIELLNIIEKKYKNVSIKIAQNARDIKNININLLNLLKIFTSNVSLKLYLDIFIDFDKNESLIKLYKTKFTNRVSENEFSFFIWKNIELKFHNYSWSVDFKHKDIKNFTRKKCQQLEQLEIKNKNIYLKDSIDIYENWDLFIHDNLCNIWDLRISNIFLDSSKILNDFEKYIFYLKDLEKKSISQKQMCFLCISNWYKYNNYE